MNRLLAVLMVAALFGACKKDDDGSAGEVSQTVQNGQWRITKFIEDSVDHTSYFTGYVFTFNENGTVTATNGSNTVSGTWGTRNDSGKTKFDLYFSSPYEFEEISEDWVVLSFTSTLIDLEHISGGDGSIDHLTFEKI
ncbi:MAG: hypothetical protein RMK52_07535 [Chitinophagales bacterium]|nr:META domain-containing protein [Chitinophagales bacterium]MDW8394079.1 hypothetical protein [Chitinophagales bacterium]